MKNLFKTMLLVKAVIFILLTPNLTIAQEVAMPESYMMVSIQPLEKIKVGASGAISETITLENLNMKVYSKSIIKVRREPSYDQSNIVGLIPANAEMVIIENVDDIWTKVEMNNK